MASNWEIGGIATMLAVLVGGGIYVGDLRSDVDALTERVKQIEDSPNNGPAGHYDVCLRLVQELGRTKDLELTKITALKEQLEQQGCNQR